MREAAPIENDEFEENGYIDREAGATAVVEHVTTRAIRSKTADDVGPFILYEGCTMSRRMVGSRYAAQFVLDKYGFDYETLDKERCCGAPVRRSGGEDEADKLRDYNLDLVVRAGHRTLVTACPGCGSQLKSAAAEARGITVVHYVLLIYLLAKNNELYLPEHMREIPPLKVTAHNPCHLHRGMGVSLGYGSEAETEEIDSVDIYRTICDAFPMLEYVEMPEKDSCCGAGGGVRASQKDLSYKIRERKLRHIERVDPHICMAACPFCELQIDEGLRGLQEEYEDACAARALTPQGMIAVMFTDLDQSLMQLGSGS